MDLSEQVRDGRPTWFPVVVAYSAAGEFDEVYCSSMSCSETTADQLVCHFSFVFWSFAIERVGFARFFRLKNFRNQGKSQVDFVRAKLEEERRLDARANAGVISSQHFFDSSHFQSSSGFALTRPVI